MFKKTLSALAVACVMLVSAAAAGSIFPAERTDIDGVTRAGYLDEDGMTVLPFAYAQAGDFADCGLAAVENDKWQTAVIDRTGHLVIDYTDAPVSVDFSDNMVAYRYTDHSVYYTTAGQRVGSYPGAVGFFEDGLLLCKNADTGLYSFVTQSGTAAFDGVYRNAGSFSGGRTLVRTQDGDYQAIDTTGAVLYTLPSDLTPSYMTIYGESTVVVTNGTNQALYSLSEGRLLTDFLYNTITEFRGGEAMVRQINRWGIMDTTGKLLTTPTYYYLSYMGEGLYAARSEDGSVAAVDSGGSLSYRTLSYISGFSELRFGLSWHNTADGTLIFFRKNGGFSASLKNAENPTILTENVVRVTQDGTVKYINLATHRTLFEQPKKFDLGSGISANTVHYEKFMGYQADGSEHGWDVDFPEISGLADTKVQSSINNTIRSFFLEGPSVTAEYEALEGGYGASVEGSVLVVWANCVSGKGTGAAVWNSCLAFDLCTGKQYTAAELLTGDYLDTVKALLPDEHPFYLYSFPRMSEKGITYYYNEYESASRRAYTEEYLLTFEQLDGVVDKSGACWAALHTPYSAVKVNAAQRTYSDVPATHWAKEYIDSVTEQGLMTGDKGRFRPNDRITAAEVCTTIARRQGLTGNDSLPAGVSTGEWYSEAVSAVYAAGLLDGLSDNLKPTAAMTREDAMQLFANLLVQNGKTAPSGTETAQTLAGIKDADSISAARRAAAALCIKSGLVSGFSDGTLKPQGTFTRAEFAKLLMTL